MNHKEKNEYLIVKILDQNSTDNSLKVYEQIDFTLFYM